MRRRTKVLCALTLLGTLSGCSVFFEEHETTSPLVVVLFDISHSTNSAVVRDRYLKDFHKILLERQPHERVLAGVIDSNSLSGVDLPIDIAMPAYSALETNRYAFDQEVDSQRQEALALAERILSKRQPMSGTDLFGGFLLAQELFDGYPEANPRRLVVFTDGLQVSRSSVGLLPMPSGRVSSVLRKLASSDQIPQLHGVEVAIVGPGNGRRELSVRQLVALERFWRRFIERTGATISKAGFAPRLITWR